MALQPRNTKIMRREGPWGRAGWFRSRYLTLTDATAGRLERSRRHSAAEQPPQPATSPRLGRRRFRQAPATGSHPTRWEQGDLRVQPSQAGGWGGGMDAREWGQGRCRARRRQPGSPEGTLALRCGYVCERHTEHATVLV